MLRNRYVVLGGILAILIVANIIRYFVLNWGLVTVTVHNEPLGQVIKSIERQGWVKIYTNMDLTTPVSMYVVKVPVAEAMETLTANVSGEWKLGFFAAPNSAGVKQEILAFEGGSAGDDSKIFSYATPLDILSPDNGSSAGDDGDDDDAGLPASDPRRQSWAGYKPPAVQVTPVSGDSGDGSADAPATPPPAPTTVQDYLQAMAEQSDIWVMTPSAWTPAVPGPPAPNSSIISAVKSLVSAAHGTVQDAIILQARHHHFRGPRDGGGTGDTDWSYMADRVSSAISGLPPEAQAPARAALNQEIKFQQEVQAAPPEQRLDMLRKHFMAHMGRNNWRRSPEKRAQMYQRAVANRQAALGR